MSDQALPTLIHRRYRVQRPLGEGGMGTSFLVDDELSGRRLALKLLHEANQALLADFKAEFRVLSGFVHPNLCQVYDFGTFRDGARVRPYYTADFVDGVSLDDFACERTWTEVMPALVDTLEALRVLHAHGLRHGDVKGENVLVDADGRAIVIDLGCSRPLSAAVTGTVSGTPGFMAPELFRVGKADHRADLYSFGVVLQRLIASGPRDEPPALIETLCQRLMAESPDDRPVDVGEVLDAFGVSVTRRPRLSLTSAELGRERRRHVKRAEASLARVAAARSGPRCVLIAGQAGMGKTRLLNEIKWSAQQRFEVVEGKAHRPAAFSEILRRVCEEPTLPSDFQGLLRALATLRERTEPVALVLDDVDELAVEERELWWSFVRSLAEGDPIIVIGAVDLNLLSKVQVGHLTLAIELEPLSLDATVEWLGEELTESSLRELHRLTGGVPATLVALVAQLELGHWTADDLRGRAEALVEGDVAIMEVGTLSNATRRGLGLIAASESVLSLGDTKVLGIAPEVLSELLDAGVIRRSGEEITLLHPGSSGKILAALPAALRRRCHQRLERFLVESGNEDDLAAVSRAIAQRIWHLLRAGEHDDARELFSAEWERALQHPALWSRVADALVAIDARAEVVERAAAIQEAAGHPERAVELVDRALEGSTELERELLASLLARRGACLIKLGETKGAIESLEDAADVAESDEGRLQAADGLSRALVISGDYEGAHRVVVEALERCRPESEELRAALEHDIGVAASYLGRFDEARRALSRAARVYDAAGDPRSAYRSLSYEAFNEFRAGNARAAADGYARALELAEQSGLGDEIALAALNLAVGAHQLGDYGRALGSYERGLVAAIALGRLSTEAMLRTNRAKLAADIGLFEGVDDQITLAQSCARRADMSVLEGVLEAVRGELLQARGERREASLAFEAAGRIFSNEGATREAHEVDLQLGELELERGELDAARRRLQLVSAFDLDAADLRARRHLLEGKIAAAQGDHSRALGELERAEGIAEDLGQPQLSADIQLALTELHNGQGSSFLAENHRERARLHWERVATGLPPHLRDAFWRHPRRLGLNDVGTNHGQGTRREQRLEQLLAINRRLNSSLKTQDVLEYTMDAAVDFTGAERGFLLLVGEGEPEEGEKLEVIVARNLDREKIGRSHLKFSRGIAEQVIASEEPIVTVDARSDQRFSGQESVHAMRLKSVVSVPIIAPHGVLGAIYLDNRFQRGRFEELELELLSAFADQVALALTNARLVDTLEQQKRVLERQKKEIQRKSAKVEELARGQAEEIDLLRREVQSRQEALEHRYDYSNIIGRGPAMHAVFSVLDRVTDVSATVLIQGESGTGKELVARTIHYNGPRRAGPFVAINCGALPAELLESELFGHVRGAFTGADRDRDGLFVAAKGGSLFLDELSEMPPSMQVKLLRVLEQREVRPLGSTKDIPVDIRLICATNRPLYGEVEARRFREDLYYRLGVVEVNLPPLRDRAEDIPGLCDHFLSRIAEEHGRERRPLAPSALRALMAYDWPGNVRQLENILTRALLLASGEAIERSSLGLTSIVRGRKSRPADRKTFEREEGEQILATLRAERWNVSKVSKILGIPRPTLYRKMKKLGIRRDDG